MLRLPQPFDFRLSTERYRAFGVDLANVVAGPTSRPEEVRPMDPRFAPFQNPSAHYLLAGLAAARP